MNKEQSKPILNVLLLKPAISSRNLTSLGLVGIFFGVYVASGGKIEGLPAVQEGASGFGAVQSSAVPPLDQDKVEAPTPGLDTSRLQFGKKGENDQPATEVESKPASGGLDSLTDRLNKVGTTRRPQ